MDDNLSGLLVGLAFLFIGLAAVVGFYIGQADARNEKTPVLDVPFILALIVGAFGTIATVVSLVAGFVDGVSS